MLITPLRFLRRRFLDFFFRVDMMIYAVIYFSSLLIFCFDILPLIFQLLL